MVDIDQIIQKYIQGQTSEEENQKLYDWVKESADNKKRLFAEKDIWDTYSLGSNSKEYNTDDEFEILMKQIVPQKSVKRHQLYSFIKVAAIIIFAFGLGWASQFISVENNESQPVVEMQEIFVPKGQINQIFLADGTRIWINSESRLSVPKVFTQNERIVKLSGEAYFDVAKDKKHPFKVDVKGQQIKVYGTTFNVRAYENSKNIETTLETGEIRLLTEGKTTVLKPGDQSLYNKENREINVNKVDPKSFSTWKDGRFEFKNENLIEVFKIVERWYDVEITVDESYFKNMHFSGVIKRNKDAVHFLELLNHTVPINYEINAEKIKIYPR